MKKKVLFVIKTLREGGAEKALSNVVTHFPTDWDIDILVDDLSLIEYPYRGNILSLGMPKSESVIYNIMSILKRIFVLKKLKKSGEYRACISFLDSSNISNVLSGSRYCKTIVSIRSDLLSKRLKVVIRMIACFLVKFLYVHADHIIVVSKEIEIQLSNRFKIRDRLQTIANGCDCKWIQSSMDSEPQETIYGSSFWGNENKRVITVGRMAEPKGQWHLIRAFSKVVKEEPDAVLVIVGDGRLRGYLEDLIKVCGLEKNVFLTGYTDNPFWYNAHADLFVLPSLYEGYPNALAEAVCCGLPCIAADVHSGAREILAPSLDVLGKRVDKISEEEFGILVPVCSGRKYKDDTLLEQEEIEMANAIIMLLENDAKRQFYKQKSIERSKDLNIDSMVRQWINSI